MMSIPAYSFSFQPIYNSLLHMVHSYEALIRGQNLEPAIKIISQIPKKSKSNFEYASNQSAVSLAKELGLSCSLNLNFTPHILNAAKTKDFIKYIDELNFSTDKIVIELTEADVIKCNSKLFSVIKLLRTAGMQIAFDDFGAGYSGLTLLVNYQPQIIKLDINLIQNIHKLGVKQVVVKAILQVCDALGIDVIAEGVESVEEFEWLQQQGVALFQGFYFAKPGFQELPSINSNLIQ